MTDELDEIRRSHAARWEQHKQDIDDELSRVLYQDEAAVRAVQGNYLRHLLWGTAPNCWRFFGRRVGRPPRPQTGTSEEDLKKLWSTFEERFFAIQYEEYRRREEGLRYRIAEWFRSHPWWWLVLAYALYKIISICSQGGQG